MASSAKPADTAASSARQVGRSARDAAVAIVADVTTRGQTVDAASARAFATDDLDRRDVALARNIALQTLRRHGSLTTLIDGYLSRGRPRNAGPLHAILTTAAAQLVIFETPAHAVINVAVAQVAGHRRSRTYKGLANAVLRRIAENGRARFAELDPLEHDIPSWLRQRWRVTYGSAIGDRIARACLTPAHLDITTKGPPEAWADALSGEVLATGSVRCPPAGPISQLPGFADGSWWVQDAAAAIPAQLLATAPGERVLDMCAAPGGKTAQLVSVGANVTALDVSPARLDRLGQNLARLGLAADLQVARAEDYCCEASFDAILVDAPCSATGTVRRHPDILHNRRAGDVTANRELQGRLLNRAADLLRPGGRLVYCTCSLEPEEGEEQISSFLAGNATMARDAIRPGNAGCPGAWLTADGDVRTLPNYGVPLAEPDATAPSIGIDGFYIARLIKQRSPTG